MTICCSVAHHYLMQFGPSLFVSVSPIAMQYVAVLPMTNPMKIFIAASPMTICITVSPMTIYITVSPMPIFITVSPMPICIAVSPMTIPSSLASLLPAGQVTQRTLKGAGHFLMLEQPTAWANTIYEFITTISKPPKTITF